ncbi:MAG: hypothetical protein ACFE9R_04560 [Candidatus Hermodarchaeota archaeon]
MKIRERISSLFLNYKSIRLKEVLIDHDKYLGKQKNKPTIYLKNPSKFFISPFNMTFDEIFRLVSISFEGDELYYSIEIQVFKINDLEYPLVILYRKDKLMDIYFSNPHILESREETLKDLISYVSFNHLDNINFKIIVEEYGLDCSLNLIDKFGRAIEFNIREQCANKELTSMLTPTSAERKEPLYFPIIYLDKFGMVEARNTIMSIKINGEMKQPAEIPFKVNGKQTYMTQYSLNPVICNWNNSYQGELSLNMIDNDNSSLIRNGITYTIINNHGFIEIEKILGIDKKGNKVFFEFSPAIPNLLALENNLHLNGKFSCGINEKKGIFVGNYSIRTIENTISLEIVPIKGWQPFPGKLWIKTYKWISDLTIYADTKISINSYWKRV